MTDKLVGIYNANGGVLGEISYVAGKIAGSTHCALCDITHGMNPLGRKEWKQSLQCLPLPIEMVHLNEMDARTRAAFAGVRPPAIMLLSSQQDRVLVEADEVEACGKDAQKLVDLILARLS